MLTFILVHGALLTSNAWLPVQNYLQNHGYNVVTVNVPGRADDDIAAKDATLAMAADKVCKIAALQAGKVILAGHSQGGAVITQAIDQCGSSIAGLVYVAAVVPASGEKVFALLSDEDNANFDKIAALNQQAGLFEINYSGPIKDMFMADASNEQAKHAINNLVPEPARIGDDILKYNQQAFNKIPKFYVTTTEDKIISPATQNKYIGRVHINHLYTLKGGHSPFVSQPKKLGEILIKIHDELS